MNRKLRYVSVFSGIEAVSCALDPDLWEPVAFSEIDPFPSAVLAHHYPDVPNLGDITKIDWTPYVGSVDVVWGGSPCQSFSLAGNREGLKGASGLMFEFIRCVRELGPRWFVWENVPGALSSENGHAFGQLLSEMAGGGMAWRGEYWTRSSSVWPSDASVCFLSEVLEPCVARKYFLSAKACRGILRRAETRGKPLPGDLRTALERQIRVLESELPRKQTDSTIPPDPQREPSDTGMSAQR